MSPLTTKDLLEHHPVRQPFNLDRVVGTEVQHVPQTTISARSSVCPDMALDIATLVRGVRTFDRGVRTDGPRWVDHPSAEHLVTVVLCWLSSGRR